MHEEINQEFELYLEIDIKIPFKRTQKQEAVDQLINQLLHEGSKSAVLKDTYYIDKKSAEAGHTIALILEIAASISVITASALGIRHELTKNKNKGIVFLKKKNGDYMKITEDMTVEDIKKKLKKDEESEK